MHKIIAAAILVSLAPAANASPVCNALSELAESVMQARQAGVDMSDMYQSASEGESEKINNIHRQLVRMAFSIPAYNTPEFKDREIRDFKNKAFATCVEARNE